MTALQMFPITLFYRYNFFFFWRNRYFLCFSPNFFGCFSGKEHFGYIKFDTVWKVSNSHCDELKHSAKPLVPQKYHHSPYLHIIIETFLPHTQTQLFQKDMLYLPFWEWFSYIMFSRFSIATNILLVFSFYFLWAQLLYAIN